MEHGMGSGKEGGEKCREMRKGAQEGEKSEVSGNYLQSLGEREMCGERRWLLPSSHVLDVCC